MKVPILVAHRGDADRYPENTLEGIEAAMRAGACIVEFDVQLSQDLVPVIYHDDTLNRTSGEQGSLLEMKVTQLQEYTSGEPARFGDKFKSIKIPLLSELVTLMKSWPKVQLMVEIKEESLDKFGYKKVVEKIVEVLEPIQNQCIIISYHADSLSYSNMKFGYRIGWVLHRWDEASHAHARVLQPHYLICNHTKIPAGQDALWPGPWHWVFYEVIQPEVALDLAERGADFVETMEIKKMLSHPELIKAAYSAE